MFHIFGDTDVAAASALEELLEGQQVEHSNVACNNSLLENFCHLKDILR